MSFKDQIFGNFPDDVFKIFMPFVREEIYPVDSVIFKEGSSADRFFIIKDGEVEIRKVIDDRNYKLVSILTKGEFFGEIAIFQGQPRTADARAKTKVTVLSVSKDDLISLFKGKSSDPAFNAMGFFASVLMDRLQNTTKELTALYETGRLITSARSVSELSDYVMENVLKAVETASAGLFAVWNDFNREFEVSSHRGFDLKEGDFIPVEESLIEWFVANKEAFVSFDLQNDPRLSISDASIFFKARSMTASPFFSEDRLTGFIVLLNREKPNAFSYSQMILLSAICGYVSVALENLKYLQDEIDRLRLTQMKSKIPI